MEQHFAAVFINLMNLCLSLQTMTFIYFCLSVSVHGFCFLSSFSLLIPTLNSNGIMRQFFLNIVFGVIHEYGYGLLAWGKSLSFYLDHTISEADYNTLQTSEKKLKCNIFYWIRLFVVVILEMGIFFL